MEQNYTKIEHELPLIPLRGLAIFPYMILNFDVGREMSLKALDASMQNEDLIFLTSQKAAETDEPTEEDFYHVGTVCKVKQMIKLPGDTVRVLVEGISRGKIKEVEMLEEGYYKVLVEEIVYDYENAEAIQTELYEKGLDETYIVETHEKQAEAGVSSVKNVKSFATTFLIITLLIGGVVLFILNMINIRERKYEIGVFRTIGISKLKLTMQFASELSSEIENATNSRDKMQNNFGGPGGMPGGMPGGDRGGNMPDFNKMSGVPTIQAYDSIDAVVNITVILELLVIGLSLVFVSSLASMVSIQRFSPLTILKERS